MLFKGVRIFFVLGLLTVLWAGNSQATNRWDILKWCTANTPEDLARCEGFLRAALDLETSEDFSGSRSCFHPDVRLLDVRLEAIAWLKENKTTPEKSGLALVARAIREQFPCVE